MDKIEKATKFLRAIIGSYKEDINEIKQTLESVLRISTAYTDMDIMLMDIEQHEETVELLTELLKILEE